jgi:hypothetical protein
MVRLFLAAILFGSISVGRAGAAPLLQSQDPGFIANCAKMHGPSQSAVAACVDAGERALVAQFVPAELPYYDELAARRTQIAAALDDGRITLGEAKAEMGSAWGTFNSRTQNIAAASNAAVIKQYGYTPEQMRAFNAAEAAAGASEAAEDQRIQREERRTAGLRALGDGLSAAGASMQSAAEADGRAAQSIQPPPLPAVPPSVTFDPGYSRKPPPTVVCAGQVMISGPPDQASNCAGGP